MKMPGRNPNSSTRRDVLGHAGRALCSIALVASGYPLDARAGKASKEDMAYQKQPRNGKDCASCKQFSATTADAGNCTVVEGEVSAHGWCMAYTAK
jgi:hypothetical protein